MKIFEVVDHDHAHGEALRDTGFWGKTAAGCMFLAKDTGRLGLTHRSEAVEQPNTFGTVGGAIDPGEDPAIATVREAKEEVGYSKAPGDYLLPLDVFQSDNFRYDTFLYVVETEFHAILDWESQDFVWFDFGRWPQPLHFGIAGTLSKPNCVNIIRSEIAKYQRPKVINSGGRQGNADQSEQPAQPQPSGYRIPPQNLRSIGQRLRGLFAR